MMASSTKGRMMLFLATLVASVVMSEESVFQKRQQVLVTNPVIFGLDLLGWGVDLKLGKPEEAIKVPIYQWTYDDLNNYLYPLEPKTTFRVPDDVYVRTVAELYSTTKLFTSAQDWVNFLKLQLGLSIDASSNSSSSGGGGGGNSTLNTGSFSLAEFQGNVDVVYQTNQLSSQNHMLIYNSLESGLWQLVIGPTIGPRQQVIDKINEAVNLTLGGDTQAYARFINRIGTHYIESVIVGGKLELSSDVSTNTSLNRDEINVAAGFEFKNLFGLDKGNLTANLNVTNAHTTFQQTANNWMKALGGDPELANFFSGNLDPEDTFPLWQETLISNPAPIRYRLREISWLFDNFQRQPVSDAVTSYLNGIPNFDEN